MADVAVGERAEHRIGQRVQRHVGVGMADDAAACGNAHAAQHHVVAVAERWTSKPDARAHVASAQRSALGAREIVGGGEFHVACLAFEHRHRHAGPFGERRVVGEILAARRRGARCASDQRARTRTPAASAPCAGGSGPASPPRGRPRSSSPCRRRAGAGIARRSRRRRNRHAIPGPARRTGGPHRGSARCRRSRRERVEAGRTDAWRVAPPRRPARRCRGPDGALSTEIVGMDHRLHERRRHAGQTAQGSAGSPECPRSSGIAWEFRRRRVVRAGGDHDAAADDPLGGSPFGLHALTPHQ